MRLIDADELKRDFQDKRYWTYTHEYGDAIPIGWIMSSIDNAPTVDIKTEVSKELAKEGREIADENYKYGYEKGKADAERPQGEWVDTNEAYIVNENGERVPNSGISECSVCKQRVAPLFMGARNFCPNCGADMRGGNQ